MPGTPWHRQCENIQRSLGDLVGIWNRDLTRVRAPCFPVRPETDPFTALHLLLLFISIADPTGQRITSNSGYVEGCRHILR